MLDRWARAALLGGPQVKAATIWAIREAAHAAGIVRASIQELYMARAHGSGRQDRSGHESARLDLSTCRAVFRAAEKLDASLLIFEQAIGEGVFAEQPPAEYAAGVLAAALSEGYSGPIFLRRTTTRSMPRPIQ